MSLLLFLPAVLSVLVLGAHYLRSGQLFVVAVLLACLLLPLVRAGWARRLLQAVLLLGALEWVRTLVQLARVRLALGEPWLRMVLILGGVAAFTLFSALLLETRRVRERAATPRR